MHKQCKQMVVIRENGTGIMPSYRKPDTAENLCWILPDLKRHQWGFSGCSYLREQEEWRRETFLQSQRHPGTEVKWGNDRKEAHRGWRGGPAVTSAPTLGGVQLFCNSSCREMWYFWPPWAKRENYRIASLRNMHAYVSNTAFTDEIQQHTKAAIQHD